MARIAYALSGQGRGHTSRVMAVSDALRRAGHTVRFCCGGTARDILEHRGETVIPVPALRQVIDANRVRLGRTMACNAQAVLGASGTIDRLTEALEDERPDLLITDFEAFTPRAARRLGIPVLSFNHQEVVTETKYPLPLRYWHDVLLTTGAIRMIAPRDPAHRLLTSFFFPPLKDPSRATLVPPILRDAVRRQTPTRGEHVVVYYNQPEGAAYVLDVLRQVDAPFVLYNFTPPDDPAAYPNLTFKPPSLAGFLDDLASCRAVLSTAGFTLTSEALYLGKPLLVVPNRGVFEQTLNALFLRSERMGETVLDRPLTTRDVTGFLTRCEAYGARLHRRRCGNKAAIACIERVLCERRPTYHARPAATYEPVGARSFPSPAIGQE